MNSYPNFVRERINELRIKNNMSEYQLSLDLGYCKGYIQSISSGRVLPSMEAFFEICDFFNLTPAEFFDPTIKNPSLLKSIFDDAKTLSESDLLLLSSFVKRMIDNNEEK